MAFDNEAWDQTKILDLAKTTGKPLEVECALRFIESNASNAGAFGPSDATAFDLVVTQPWRVELGSYYRDDATEKLRELDVLATRTKLITRRGPGQIHTFVRVMMSCKGFPPGFGPVAFSLKGATVDTSPAVMFGESNSNGFPNDFVNEAAKKLLTAVGLRGASGNEPMIIGYNIFQEEVNSGLKTYKRNKEREKDLFENGMDSAIKAAVAWRALIFPTHVPAAGTFIPIMVTEKPWWQFPVDGGQAAAPILKKRGFLVNSYPITRERRMPLDLLSLMCTKDELSGLITNIESFADWFGDETAMRFRAGHN